MATGNRRCRRCGIDIAAKGANATKCDPCIARQRARRSGHGVPNKMRTDVLGSSLAGVEYDTATHAQLLAMRSQPSRPRSRGLSR